MREPYNTLELQGEELERYREVRARKEIDGVNYAAIAPNSIFRLLGRNDDRRHRRSTAGHSDSQWNGGGTSTWWE